MQPQLTPKQQKIHSEAIYLARRRESLDARFVEVLREVEQLKLPRKFGKSLFKYAVDILKVDVNIYPLISVARNTIRYPELRQAVQNKTLSLSKASRILSSLTPQTEKELVEFAKAHTRDQIDHEMAKRNPKARCRDKAKPISDDEVEVKFVMKRSAYEKWLRAQSLEAQKQKSTTFGDVAEAMAEVYLEKNDPVRKAKRAVERVGKKSSGKTKPLWQARVKNKNAEKSSSPIRVSIKKQITSRDSPNNATKRIPLTAEQKHAVNLRDKGRCTYHDGKHVCGTDKWTEIHHIIRVADGGTNDLDNLTTLCWYHHDLIHQIKLPIDRYGLRIVSAPGASDPGGPQR